MSTAYARRACLAVVVVLLATPVAAQEDPTSRRAAVVDIPLLERSRIFKNAPDDHTRDIYEGILALHFPLHGGMQKRYDDASMGRKATWAWLPSFSMIVNLRQFKEDSAPVRTPSYMPRLRMTAVHSARPAANTTSRQWVFDGTFGHYSNGQAGCPFVGQDAGDDCTFATPVADRDLKENDVDGSFSSHYLEAGVAHRWLKWGNPPAGNGRGLVSRVVTGSLRVRDYRTLSGVPGGMNDDLMRLYGSFRIRGGGEVLSEGKGEGRFRGPRWFSGWAEVSNGNAPQIEKWRLLGEIGKTLDGLNGVGFIVQGYWGHDDYNISFLHPIKVVRVGVTLGGERRPTFKP